MLVFSLQKKAALFKLCFERPCKFNNNNQAPLQNYQVIQGRKQAHSTNLQKKLKFFLNQVNIKTSSSKHWVQK